MINYHFLAIIEILQQFIHIQVESRALAGDITKNGKKLLFFVNAINSVG